MQRWISKLEILYLKELFKTGLSMNKITSIEDINALIAAGVEESTTLEYKSDINTSND